MTEPMTMTVPMKVTGKSMPEAAETGAPHAARGIGSVAGRGKARRIWAVMAAASRLRRSDRQAACGGGAHEQQHDLA